MLYMRGWIDNVFQIFREVMSLIDIFSSVSFYRFQRFPIRNKKELGIISHYSFANRNSTVAFSVTAIFFGIVSEEFPIDIGILFFRPTTPNSCNHNFSLQ